MNQAITQNENAKEEATKIMNESYSNNEKKNNISIEDSIPKEKETYFKCEILVHLTDGTTYKNFILITLEGIKNIREMTLKNMEDPEKKALLSITGTERNDNDFCVIPIRNILYTQLNVLHMYEKKEDEEVSKIKERTL